MQAGSEDTRRRKRRGRVSKSLVLAWDAWLLVAYHTSPLYVLLLRYNPIFFACVAYQTGLTRVWRQHDVPEPPGQHPRRPRPLASALLRLGEARGGRADTRFPPQVLKAPSPAQERPGSAGDQGQAPVQRVRKEAGGPDLRLALRDLRADKKGDRAGVGPQRKSLLQLLEGEPDLQPGPLPQVWRDPD